MDVAELEGEADAGDGTRPVVDVGAAAWRTSLLKARDVLGCDFFDWLSAVDEDGDGIRLVAHVWSIREKAGVIVRTLLPADALVAESVVDVYPGAEWHERETHEMFGVDFTGHPHLAPLLLPPEFEGHPLRKDFVLASRVAKPWPGAKEPGEGHGAPGARKRAPMRPPGVPEPGTWGPAEATEAAGAGEAAEAKGPR
ncbi:MAG TPA: NADH-quinone oxidoreductase subunit C, partial [Phytomonospora sp.]